MQALLVVDFLQELPDQSLGFLEVAVLGAVDFLVFESLLMKLSAWALSYGVAKRLILMRMPCCWSNAV